MKSIIISVPSVSLRNPFVVKEDNTTKALENKTNTSNKEDENWGKNPELLKVKSLLNLSGKEKNIRTGGEIKALSFNGHIELNRKEERVGWLELENETPPTPVIKTSLELSEVLPKPEKGKLVIVNEDVARYVWETTNRRDVVYVNDGKIVKG